MTDEEPASSSDDGPQPGRDQLSAVLGSFASGASGSESDANAAAADRSTRCRIDLQNPCRYPEAGARKLRPWLEVVVGELAAGARTLTVRFVSDREMRRLNGTFRHRDKATDVLSFPGDLAGSATAPEEAARWPESGHLGDIAVAVPTARRQAADRRQRVDRELRLLVLHGLLHCLGFDHETDDGEMERVEAALRDRYLSLGGATTGS